MKSRDHFPLRDQIPTGASPCEYCDGRCCRYIALPAETPETYPEYDFLRWFLLHERVCLFRDGETWFLLVLTPCRYLGDDHRCGIYLKRPQICRDYSDAKCEYRETLPHEGFFEVPDQVEEYAEAVLGPRSGRSFRSAKNPDAGW